LPENGLKCRFQVCFHGAFKKKSDAVAKEREVGSLKDGKLVTVTIEGLDSR